MNRINTVENKVLQILRDSPETRYEDMKLYYRYYNRYADDLRAGELPLGTWHTTTNSTDCRALSPSAGRGSVYSPFSRTVPKGSQESDGGVVIVINII